MRYITWSNYLGREILHLVSSHFKRSHRSINSLTQLDVDAFLLQQSFHLKCEIVSDVPKMSK